VGLSCEDMMEEKEIKLFTVGPAQMYQHTMDVRSRMVPYFRTDEFSKVMLENARLMRKIMDAEEDAEVMFLTASGSGAMEATVMNCFDQNDKLLVISGGTFGERFEKICEIHNIPFVALKLGHDEQLTAKHFLKYDNQGFTGLLVNLHETYTGQLYDINIIHDFCERNNLYLVVDAISTFLCDEYHMKKYNVDATIVSSQKGLCLAPGLSIVVLSNRMVQQKVLKNQIQSLYFDFKDYIQNIQRGQTPFTPCVGVCFELNDMLRYIDDQGVEKRVQEVKDRCDYFRSKIVDLPIHLPEFPLSNAISPIRFEKDIAMDFFNYLKNEKHIMVNPVGGELGKCSIRVAHIGDLTFADYDMLLEEIKHFFGM
jgi:aspartate aminotransferase-like enzyme